MTDLNTSTEAAIGFIPCYRLPFLSLFHADCSEGWKHFETKARYFSDFIRNKEWFYEI